MAISTLDLYLGYSGSSTLDNPAAPRLRTLRRAGFVILICGALLRIWVMRVLGRLFTFRLAVRKDHKVVRTGPFGYVRFVMSCLKIYKFTHFCNATRHPSYIGAQVMIIGELLLLLSGNVGQQYFGTASLAFQTLAFTPVAIAALSSVFLIPRITKEEKMLSEALGAEWRIYTSEVKWRLLPGIF